MVRATEQAPTVQQCKSFLQRVNFFLLQLFRRTWLRNSAKVGILQVTRQKWGVPNSLSLKPLQKPSTPCYQNFKNLLVTKPTLRFNPQVFRPAPRVEQEGMDVECADSEAVQTRVDVHTMYVDPRKERLDCF
jgi:hypothetical protein